MAATSGSPSFAGTRSGDAVAPETALRIQAFGDLVGACDATRCIDAIDVAKIYAPLNRELGEIVRRLLLSIALLLGLSGVTFGQTTSASEIAPGGKLRVGMIAIAVLGGVAEPVARFIGQKLGVPVEPVMYPNPEAYLQSFGKGEWDVAIGPRVLAPTDKADSTADLWVISLIYVAAPGKSFPISLRSTRQV